MSADKAPQQQDYERRENDLVSALALALATIARQLYTDEQKDKEGKKND